MAQINVNNLTFAYNGSFDNIFENISFCIDTDWNIVVQLSRQKSKTFIMN